MSWINPFHRTRRNKRAPDRHVPEIGRKLYSFDIEAIAPYDHQPLMAFLKADKLADLSIDEIRIFLLLRDNPDPAGYTEAYIAEWLEMPMATTQSCLGRLKWKGYAKQTNVISLHGKGADGLAWIVNRANEWADPDLLFWEFSAIWRE